VEIIALASPLHYLALITDITADIITRQDHSSVDVNNDASADFRGHFPYTRSDLNIAN
jgi:hypothetical protein